MNGFLACDVLNFFNNNKLIFGSWNKIKINIYFSFESFSIKLDYVIKIYVYIFLSHNLLYMMWSQVREFFLFRVYWVLIGKCRYFFISAQFFLFVSMNVLFTLVWTVVFMYQGNNC